MGMVVEKLTRGVPCATIYCRSRAAFIIGTAVGKRSVNPSTGMAVCSECMKTLIQSIIDSEDPEMIKIFDEVFPDSEEDLSKSEISIIDWDEVISSDEFSEEEKVDLKFMRKKGRFLFRDKESVFNIGQKLSKEFFDDDVDDESDEDFENEVKEYDESFQNAVDLMKNDPEYLAKLESLPEEVKEELFRDAASENLPVPDPSPEPKKPAVKKPATKKKKPVRRK